MAVKAIVSLKDSMNRGMKKQVETVATTLADAETYFAAWLAAFQDVSDIGTEKVDYVLAAAEENAAEAGANRDVGATLRVTLDNGKHYALKIPCIKSTLYDANGNIDIEDESILAYVALFETAGHLRVSEGNYVVALLSGAVDK
jgi:hypothetical protein